LADSSFPLDYNGHSSWKHWYGHNPIVIWRYMPARTCGRRNCSPRYQLFNGFFGAWEITHGKPPTAPSNPHSRRQEDAFQGSYSSVSGKTEACWHRWGRRRHASVFKPGFVTFVGKREPGIWSFGLYQTSGLWSS
jgi:hypothetical protein